MKSNLWVRNALGNADKPVNADMSMFRLMKPGNADKLGNANDAIDEFYNISEQFSRGNLKANSCF